MTYGHAHVLAQPPSRFRRPKSYTALAYIRRAERHLHLPTDQCLPKQHGEKRIR